MDSHHGKIQWKHFVFCSASTSFLAATWIMSIRTLGSEKSFFEQIWICSAKPPSWIAFASSQVSERKILQVSFSAEMTFAELATPSSIVAARSFWEELALSLADTFCNSPGIEDALLSLRSNSLARIKLCQMESALSSTKDCKVLEPPARIDSQRLSGPVSSSFWACFCEWRRVTGWGWAPPFTSSAGPPFLAASFLGAAFSLRFLDLGLALVVLFVHWSNTLANSRWKTWQTQNKLS